MAIHSSNSLEMPLLASAFSSVLPHVICGQPTGRECASQLVSNCRGARLMGIRATWPAQRRSYKRFECNRDPKLSEVKCLEHRRSPTTRRSIYTSSSRCGAPHCGAASNARACSSVAVKCKAACLSVYTYKLTSYMSLCLWAILQENYREEYGLQTPTEP